MPVAAPIRLLIKQEDTNLTSALNKWCYDHTKHTHKHQYILSLQKSPRLTLLDNRFSLVNDTEEYNKNYTKHSFLTAESRKLHYD